MLDPFPSVGGVRSGDTPRPRHPSHSKRRRCTHPQAAASITMGGNPTHSVYWSLTSSGMEATFSRKVTMSKLRHSGRASSSSRIRRSWSGCWLRTSARPFLSGFSAELPWHGEPPPRMIPRTVRRCKNGRSTAPVTFSTASTATTWDKHCWVAWAGIGSFSAATAWKRVPIASSAKHRPLKPAQRSITSHAPTSGRAQTNCGRSPKPRHATCFAARSCNAAGSECCCGKSTRGARSKTSRMPLSVSSLHAWPWTPEVPRPRGRRSQSSCCTRVWARLRHGLPLGNFTSQACRFSHCPLEQPRPSLKGLHRRLPPFTMLTVANLSALRVRGRLVAGSPSGRVSSPGRRLGVAGCPDPADPTNGEARGDRHSKWVSCKACFKASDPGNPRLTCVASFPLVRMSFLCIHSMEPLAYSAQLRRAPSAYPRADDKSIIQWRAPS